VSGAQTLKVPDIGNEERESIFLSSFFTFHFSLQGEISSHMVSGTF